MKKLSIIVPCYNAENHIEKCLSSLVNQTISDFEIIVINDGSSDSSLKIITSFKEKYPEIIRVYNQENMGIASVRNRGMDLVEGEYFGFLDSDDYTDKDMFLKMYTKAKEDDSDLVVSNFYWVNKEEKRLEVEGVYKPGKEMVVKLFATLWNKIYKTSFIKDLKLRFPDGNRYEDACFLYCLAPHLRKISFVDEAFVNYVQVETSITHTNNDQVKNMINVFNIIYDYYKEKGFYEDYHDELEYIHIKFFLGNSFLRSSLIKDPLDRKNTILMGFNLLNEKFPTWNKSRYLREIPSKKHLYFRSVRRWNIFLYSWLYRNLKKIAV